MRHEVVRSLGSAKTHNADVSEEVIEQLTIFGSNFEGVLVPVATRCQRTMKRYPVVIMNAGSKVNCRECLLLPTTGGGSQ